MILETPKLQVSAIVCCYNEELYLQNVIESLLSTQLFSKVIIVNDGSTDGSAKILENFKTQVSVITNSTNLGKGASVAQALESISTELVVLLDGDVLNYSTRDLTNLIQPVIKNQARWTLKITDDLISTPLSGIRCYHTQDLIPHINSLAQTSRYGLEICLNRLLKNQASQKVKFQDHQHKNKFQKYPFFKAISAYLHEGASLLKEWLTR